MRTAVLTVFAVFVFLLAGFLLALFLWWLLSHKDEELAVEPGPAVGELPERAASVSTAEEAGPTKDEGVIQAAHDLEEDVALAPEESERPVAKDDMAAVSVEDNLRQIEGIGPKIAAVLHGAGITTFAQLAGTDANQLKAILEAEDPRLLRLSDPATWPEQAQLASAGDWEALEALQGSLRGGRRLD